MDEYERELARARWRLKKLREEVKQAKRKVEEAGERNTPLQDSIRQSYEEILQVKLKTGFKDVILPAVEGEMIQQHTR